MRQLYKVLLLCFVFSLFDPSYGFPNDGIRQKEKDTLSIHPEKEVVIQKIYPNPVKNKLTVMLLVKQKGSTSIFIYDMIGNLVFKKDVYIESEGINHLSFDLSEFHSGIYILKVKKGTKAAAVRLKKL